MSYAHENPLEEVPHEDDIELPGPSGPVFDEKTESRRSGFEAPHLGHFIGSLSLGKTICSN